MLGTASFCAAARADVVGEVDTAFRLLGRDDRIVMEAYDDPKVRNVLVYLTYSDKLVEGSPKNSITAVPVSRANPIPLR